MALLLAWMVLAACGVFPGLRQPTKVGLKELGHSHGDAHHAETQADMATIWFTHLSPRSLAKERSLHPSSGPVSQISSPTYGGYMGTFVLLCPIT